MRSPTRLRGQPASGQGREDESNPQEECPARWVFGTCSAAGEAAIPARSPPAARPPTIHRPGTGPRERAAAPTIERAPRRAGSGARPAGSGADSGRRCPRGARRTARRCRRGGPEPRRVRTGRGPRRPLRGHRSRLRAPFHRGGRGGRTRPADEGDSEEKPRAGAASRRRPSLSPRHGEGAPAPVRRGGARRPGRFGRGPGERAAGHSPRDRPEPCGTHESGAAGQREGHECDARVAPPPVDDRPPRIKTRGRAAASADPRPSSSPASQPPRGSPRRTAGPRGRAGLSPPRRAPRARRRPRRRSRSGRPASRCRAVVPEPGSPRSRATASGAWSAGRT